MKYYLSLGSNRGDRLSFLRNTVTELAGLGSIAERSSIYESEPVGEKNQDWFLNAVCILNSSSRPFRLLRKLKQIETRLGRKHNKHWAAREIDIDVIDWVGEQVSTDILKIPHPVMQNRKFVLVPLEEVEPEYVMSGTNTIQYLLKNVIDENQLQKYKIQW